MAVRVDRAQLEAGKTGKVRWSGVTMKARIANEAAIQKIPHGREVYIMGMRGNTLYVLPSGIPMPTGDELKEYRKKLNLDL